MKKLILVAILFYTGIAHAGIFGKLEVGGPVGNSYFYTEETERITYKNTIFTEIQLGYRNDIFNVIEYSFYGDIKTWCEFNEKNIVLSKPFEDIYGIGIKINYGGLYVKLDHFCAHPVIHYKDFEVNKKSWMTGMTTVVGGYEFEFK